MPNPQGFNQFDKFMPTKPYGAAKRMLELTRAAPVPAAGENAAQSAQRRAQRPRGPAQPQQAAAPPPTTPAPELPYPVQLAEAWKQIALDPEASDLVRGMAEKAAALANG